MGLSPQGLARCASQELGCSLWVLACCDNTGTPPICSVFGSRTGPQAPGDRDRVWFEYPCWLIALLCLGHTTDGQRTLSLMTPVSLRVTRMRSLAQASGGLS